MSKYDWKCTVNQYIKQIATVLVNFSSAAARERAMVPAWLGDSACALVPGPSECSAVIGPPRSGPTSADPSVYVRGGPSASDRRLPAARKTVSTFHIDALGVCPITGKNARLSPRVLWAIPVFPLTDITKHEQRSLNQYFDISTGLFIFCKKKSGFFLKNKSWLKLRMLLFNAV